MNKHDRIYDLVEQLNEYNRLYDLGCPAISDKEYDDLYFELESLENETGFILGNSPTQSIDYQVVNQLTKVTHSHPMLSLNKTKDINEIESFIKNHDSISMAKMDGLTCSLHYQNGELIGAETRGNGYIGEDILHNIKYVKGAPKYIEAVQDLVIDGEVICTYKDFEPFAAEYKNPRNFASGSIRLLDSKESAKRHLTFVVWDCITGLEECSTLNEKLIKLSSLGFLPTPWLTIPEPHSLEHIVILLSNWAKDESYPIDGLVFKYDNCEEYEKAGLTGHHPKGGLAYKFYDEEYPSRLIDIEWSAGRTGVFTPVAIFEPIDMDGSVVERASLHNINIMKQTLGNPYYYQKIKVVKQNMIIPQITWGEPEREVKPTKDKMTCGFTHKDNPYAMTYPQYFIIPDICPICGESLTIVDDTFLTCANPSCDGKLINHLDHYCSNKGLEIKGLSKMTLNKLMDLGWLNSISDIYKLKEHRDEWRKLPGFGNKSVDNILAAIDASCECELWQFISALGIPLIGSTYAKDMAKHEIDWHNIREDIEGGYDFTLWEGFGIEMDKSLHKFDYTEADEIIDNYLSVKNSLFKNQSTKENKLQNLKFVITGSLNKYKNRQELQNIIEDNGGKVISSVSKNTDYLINNDIESTSSKNVKAKQLGIPIITEEDFINML